MEYLYVCLDTEHQPGHVYIADSTGRVLESLAQLEDWSDEAGAPTEGAFAEAEGLAMEHRSATAPDGYNPRGTWEAMTDCYAVSLG